jgi:plasmid maintenance system antidote protein VapI
MKMLRQQMRRDVDKGDAPLQEVDYRELPGELEASTENDLRVELQLLKEQVRVEEERLSQLITGQGTLTLTLSLSLSQTLSLTLTLTLPLTFGLVSPN